MSGEPAIVLRADEALDNGICYPQSCRARLRFSLSLMKRETTSLSPISRESPRCCYAPVNWRIVSSSAIRRGKMGFVLSAGKVANRVTVSNKTEETNAVQLYADEVSNRVTVSTIRWVSSRGKRRSRQSQSNQNRGVSLDF